MWSCTTLKLDASGRLATRTQLEELGWGPGTHMTLTVWHGAAVLFRRDENGAVTVGRSLSTATTLRYESTGVSVRYGFDGRVVDLVCWSW